MAKAALGTIVRGMAFLHSPGELSDPVLLERFLQHKDEAAFAVLVARHGGMVLGVARSILGQEQDAEDVLQNAFLLLARRASGIRKTASASSWLHGVAYRLALKTRTAKARRRRHETHVPPKEGHASSDRRLWEEVQQAVHDELDRLPERLRTPAILCYLDGLTQAQAAAHLGLPKGTLRSRLEQARSLLRERLGRRGLAPAGMLFLDQSCGQWIPLSGRLASATVQHAVTAGRASPGVVLSMSQSLGGMMSFLMSHPRLSVTILLLVLSLAAVSKSVFASRNSSNDPQEPAPGPVVAGLAPPGGESGPEEEVWGEAAFGLRFRVTAAGENPARKQATMPLTLELQNVSGQPIPLSTLPPYADPEVDDAGKRLIARTPIDIAPWTGRKSSLLPGEKLTWVVDFDRFRFATPIDKDRTSLRLRFRLALQGEPEGGGLRELRSNTIPLLLSHNHPWVARGPADLPPTWSEAKVLVYREHHGLAGHDTLKIDGQGQATLVTVGYGKGRPITKGPIRLEAILPRRALDSLARFFHDQKLWEIAELASERPPVPDEGEIQVSFGAGAGSVVHSFPFSLVQKHPKLLALRGEMAKMMALVRTEAEAGLAPPRPQWGKSLNGLRMGLVSEALDAEGTRRLWIVLENEGETDLMLKMGIMLANGKKHYPMALRLKVTNAEGKTQELVISSPRVAGRLDPFLVPLSSKNRYLVAVDPEQWHPQLPPGNYRVRAEFEGGAVTRDEVNTDTTGLALMKCWMGTISSEESPITWIP